MYLPYENIWKIVSMIFPEKYKKTISDFFMELKTSANCRYIKKNQKKVLEKLRHKYKKEPIRVAFVCFEASKWKCQSLYELLSDSDYFHPFILITKNNAPQNSSKPMTAQEVSDTYKFFKEKGLDYFLSAAVVYIYVSGTCCCIEVCAYLLCSLFCRQCFKLS